MGRTRAWWKLYPLAYGGCRLFNGELGECKVTMTFRLERDENRVCYADLTPEEAVKIGEALIEGAKKARKFNNKRRGKGV